MMILTQPLINNDNTGSKNQKEHLGIKTEEERAQMVAFLVTECKASQKVIDNLGKNAMYYSTQQRAKYN